MFARSFPLLRNIAASIGTRKENDNLEKRLAVPDQLKTKKNFRKNREVEER